MTQDFAAEPLDPVFESERAFAMCPGVSIVIPTFNRANTLPDAISSVLEQDWPAIEIVVVDDGSTDETAHLLQAFATRNPDIVRVISQTNHGVSFARNAGIQAAKYDFIAFLDSDDIWLPTKLRTQMAQFRRFPDLVLTFTGYTLDGPGGGQVVSLENWRPDQVAILEALLTGCCITTSTVVARRDALVSAGLFDGTLRCCEDHDLWLRMALGDGRIGYLPATNTRMRTQQISLSSNQSDVARSTELVFERLFASGTLPTPIQARSSFYLSRCYLNSACRHLEQGNGRASIESLWRASKIRPVSVRPGWVRIAASAVATAVRKRDLVRYSAMAHRHDEHAQAGHEPSEP